MNGDSARVSVRPNRTCCVGAISIPVRTRQGRKRVRIRTTVHYGDIALLALALNRETGVGFDHVGGFRKFIKRAARKIAKSKLIRAAAKVVKSPLFRAAIPFPAAMAIRASSKAISAVRKARRGNPQAMAHVNRLKLQARAGNPTAQRALRTAAAVEETSEPQEDRGMDALRTPEPEPMAPMQMAPMAPLPGPRQPEEEEEPEEDEEEPEEDEEETEP